MVGKELINKYIDDSKRKEKIYTLIFSPVMILAGIGCIVAGIHSSLFIICLGLPMLLIGVMLYKGQMNESEVKQYLFQSPERIVWAYEFTFRLGSGGEGSKSVRICTDNRKLFDIDAKNKEQVLEILSYIETIAPQARIGYHPEFEKAYRANPNSLRKKTS